MPLPNSAYANLALVPLRASAAANATQTERAADIARDRERESTLKRVVERANDVLNTLDARSEQLARQIKQLQIRKAANCARIEKIEDAIVAGMDNAGLKILLGVRCSMRTQPAAAALEVIDESLIPREYMRDAKRPPAQPDKVAIKTALAKLDDVSPADWGCRLTSKISLIRVS